MLHRLMPTRTQAEEPVKIVSDFDSLLSEKVGFKFQGKVHLLKPVDVENFMRVTLAYQNLLEMTGARSQAQAISDEEVYQKYFDLIHPLVPTLSYAELRAMSLVVLNGLLNLIFRQLAGDPSLYEKKDEKKNPLTQ